MESSGSKKSMVSKEMSPKELRDKYFDQISELQILLNGDEDISESEDPMLNRIEWQIDNIHPSLETETDSEMSQDDSDNEIFHTWYFQKHIKNHIKWLSDLRKDLIEFQQNNALRSTEKYAKLNSELEKFLQKIGEASALAIALDAIYAKKSLFTPITRFFSRKSKKGNPTVDDEFKKQEIIEATNAISKLYCEQLKLLELPLASRTLKDIRNTLDEKNWNTLKPKDKISRLDDHLLFFEEVKKNNEDPAIQQVIIHATSLIQLINQAIEENAKDESQGKRKSLSQRPTDRDD
jgi:hypothetical protein